ncbi:MAG TPA: cyclomaltodextrinase N-terminal domain-containing protein, partial [Bacteroidota bacterium]
MLLTTPDTTRTAGRQKRRRTAFALVAGICLLVGAMGAAQPVVTKVEPPNWWGGMRLDTVRLLLYGERLDGIRVVSRSASVKVLRVEAGASAGHAFVDVRVLPRAAGGTHRLLVLRGRDTAVVDYPVLRREPEAGRHQGFSPADVIYLLTPDRFADGDTSNDAVPGMPDAVQR